MNAEDLIEDYRLSLNRRVKVENELIAAGLGKAPLPTKEDCLRMALALGTPSDEVVAYWKARYAKESMAPNRGTGPRKEVQVVDSIGAAYPAD